MIGDMSSRPHWGLYELDFVFSTLVVRASHQGNRDLVLQSSLSW